MNKAFRILKPSEHITINNNQVQADWKITANYHICQIRKKRYSGKFQHRFGSQFTSRFIISNAQKMHCLISRIIHQTKNLLIFFVRCVSRLNQFENSALLSQEYFTIFCSQNVCILPRNFVFTPKLFAFPRKMFVSTHVCVPLRNFAFCPKSFAHVFSLK